jgi:hypothetical protein
MRYTLALRSFLGLIATIALTACGGGTSPPPFEITSGSPPNGATGVAYGGFTFVSSNGVAPVSWSESGALPPGMSLNAAGQLLGTPVTAGTYPFTVAAIDSSSPPRNATGMVSLQISDSLTVISTTSLPPSGTATYPYAGYTFTVASGGSPPFTWKVTAGALPPGLTLGSDGSLSGTPTSAGSYTFTVSATDSAQPAETESAPFTIMVGTPTAPVVSTTPAPPSGTITYPYNGGNPFAFAASGGLPPYTWAVTTGAVPAGLTLDPGGSLSGTPTTAGAVMFTVTATDSAQPPLSGSQSFPITIGTPGPPIINLTPAPPAGIADVQYPGFVFTATGGYLPLTWAVTGGALPPGLTLVATAALTGIPTTINSFPFTVTVTDSRPAPEMNSAPFSIVVTAPPPPTINGTSLPTGIVGNVYPTVTFTASNGYLPLVWSEAGTLPAGLGLNAGGVLSGTPQNAGPFPITLNVTDSLSRSAPGVLVNVRVSQARPAAAFTPTTGSMTIARSGHTATLLLSGQVLIVGGTGAPTPLASAELYDPTNEMFTATTGVMTIARSGHTATLLANAAFPNHGNVLVAGGGSQTAELFDPATGMFTATGSMVTPHAGQTATLLNTGQVLVAGGGTASAELFNPASGIFTATGSMTVARSGQTATLLLNGQVLIAGGGTAKAELYDPGSGTFTATGSMGEPRSGHTATLLADSSLPHYGSVMVAGPYLTAEVFDPATGRFSYVGELLTIASGFTASLRNDGTVVIAGGYHSVNLYHPGPRGSCSLVGSAKVSATAATVFAPESEGYTATGSLHTARYGHTATVFADGTVLVTGGLLGTVTLNRCGRVVRPVPVSSNSIVLASAELFR